MPLSAVVLTKNEEKNIAKCLESLSFVDEIIVIDDNSTDKTREIAKKYRATVYSHSLENDFAKSRNFGLEKAKNEWVLFVDADEVVTPELAQEIKGIFEYPTDRKGYFIKRQDFLWGKPLLHGEQGKSTLLRLAQKGSGTWSGRVHEVWQVHGLTAELKNSLQHFPHQSVADFLKEINFYTTLRAQELHDKKVASHWWDIIMYPKIKFIQNYLLKQGYLDGTPGFIAAMMMSFHSFLVRGKLWQLNNK